MGGRRRGCSGVVGGMAWDGEARAEEFGVSGWVPWFEAGEAALRHAAMGGRKTETVDGVL